MNETGEVTTRTLDVIKTRRIWYTIEKSIDKTRNDRCIAY